MNKKDYDNKIKLLRLNNNYRIDRYGLNEPYKAWRPENVTQSTNGIEMFECTGSPKTIYNARFCAVSGFVFAIVNGKYSILTNLRGEGTPDYQGCWNAPCGYLERFENSREGIQREIYEECGFYIDKNDLKVVYTETDPEESNNGNVTIRHTAFLGKIKPIYVKSEGGEENEVDSVKWIPIDDIDNYKWAFNHYETIKKYAPSKFKRKIIEFLYNNFKEYNHNYTYENYENLD